MRGVTLAPLVDGFRDLISTRTPHAGSDGNAAKVRDKEANFNPHSPCGE